MANLTVKQWSGQPLLFSTNLMLGTAPAAGLYHRDLDENVMEQLLHDAVVNHGITIIDTAPWYGCGKAEMDISRALVSGAVPPTANVRIATKVGRICVPRNVLAAEDFFEDGRSGLSRDVFERRHRDARQRDTCYKIHDETRDHVMLHDCTGIGIETAWSQISRRLGPHVTPLLSELRLHDADTEELIAEATSGGIERLITIARDANLGVSLGLNDPRVALFYLKEYPGGTFQSVMLASKWNLIDQSGGELLKYCEQTGVPVHIGSVFGAGLLWGGPNFNYAKAPEEILEKRRLWQVLCDRWNVRLPSLALHFAFLPTCVSHVSIGCATALELDECMALLRDPIDRRTMRGIYEDAVRDGLLPSQLLAFTER
jgi:D-threo-aldose 1-dehydrogenase